MDTSKLDLIHGACQPALNGGLVGLFNPTTVGFLTNAPISPDAPRLVLLCFVKKQYQTRGIGFKKPTPSEGAGKGARLFSEKRKALNLKSQLPAREQEGRELGFSRKNVRI